MVHQELDQLLDSNPQVDRRAMLKIRKRLEEAAKRGRAKRRYRITPYGTKRRALIDEDVELARKTANLKGYRR